MSNLIIDERIAFKSTVRLPGPTAILSVAVFGGPLIVLQAAVFDSSNRLLTAVGFGEHGAPVSSGANGTASWLFVPPAAASYVKWGVVAMRSAAGMGRYSITAKIRNAQGDALATGQFSAEIAEGSFSDDLVYDGVMVDQSVGTAALVSGAGV